MQMVENAKLDMVEETRIQIANSVFDHMAANIMELKFLFEWMITFDCLVGRQGTSVTEFEGLIQSVVKWKKEQETVLLTAQEVQVARNYLTDWMQDNSQHYTIHAFRCYRDSVINKYKHTCYGKLLSIWLDLWENLNTLVHKKGSLFSYKIIKGLLPGLETALHRQRHEEFMKKHPQRTTRWGPIKTPITRWDYARQRKTRWDC